MKNGTSLNTQFYNQFLDLQAGKKASSLKYNETCLFDWSFFFFSFIQVQNALKLTEMDSHVLLRQGAGLFWIQFKYLCFAIYCISVYAIFLH